MTSAIDVTKPVAGTPTTESVRENFQAAHNEIEALQALIADFAVTYGRGLTQTGDVVDLDIATAAQLGGVIIGPGLTISPDGTLSAPAVGGAVSAGFSGNVAFYGADGNVVSGNAVLAINSGTLTLSAAGAGFALLNFPSPVILPPGGGISSANRIYVLGGDGSNTNMVMDSFSNTPTQAPKWNGRRGRGTHTVPLAVQNGDTLSSYGGGGWDGVGFGAAGQIKYMALENWGTAAHGSGVQFDLVAAGATATTTGALFTAAGLTLPNGSLVLGAAGVVAFNGATPISKPTVSGSRAGNAALASLLTALAAYGLVTDTTTA